MSRVLFRIETGLAHLKPQPRPPNRSTVPRAKSIGTLGMDLVLFGRFSWPWGAELKELKEAGSHEEPARFIEGLEEANWELGVGSCLNFLGQMAGSTPRGSHFGGLAN